MRAGFTVAAAVVLAAGVSAVVPSASADSFAIGASLPQLELARPDGSPLDLATFRNGADGKPTALVVAFWSYKCPTGRKSMGRFAELAKTCADKGARFVGVCSYGETAADIAAYAKKNGIAYDLAVDESTKAAAALDAAVVTETYVFDRDGKLVYHGALGNGSEPWPERAVDAVLAGKTVEKAETDAFG